MRFIFDMQSFKKFKKMGKGWGSHCFRSYKLLIALILLIYCFNLTIQYFYYYYHSSSPISTCVSTNNQQKVKMLNSNGSEITLDINYVQENLASLDQKDPQLIQYTRLRHLTPPSKLPYNFDNKKANFKAQTVFSTWIAKFFGNKRDGIFIEAGANAGERGSHTLYLEKKLGWTGLLVECNPKVTPFLKTKHRKAWIADVCLSLTPNAGTVHFSNPTSWKYSDKIGTVFKFTKIPPLPRTWEIFDVETMPLYTILAALGWKEVDYFNLEIEGQELLVLKNFPFELVTFKVIIAASYVYYEAELAEIDNFMKSKGYLFVDRISIDRIYVHEKYKEMIPKN